MSEPISKPDPQKHKPTFEKIDDKDGWHYDDVLDSPPGHPTAPLTSDENRDESIKLWIPPDKREE